MPTAGWFQCPSALIDCDTLSGSEKLVLLALLRHRDNTYGTCFPSVVTLMKETGLCRQWVVKHIASLEEKELIEVRRTKGKPNIYYLPQIEELAIRIQSVLYSYQSTE